MQTNGRRHYACLPECYKFWFVQNTTQQCAMIVYNKMLSYSRAALRGALILAKSERLELGDNILCTL